jgi:predicted small secreted protein
VSLRRTAALPAVLLAAATLLAGCASADGDGTGGVTDAGATAAVSSSAAASSGGASSGGSSSAGATAGTGGADRSDDGSSDAPPFPATTGEDSSDASADASVTVTDIRTGRHDGYDRVVFELGGTGTPGWDVAYVDQPASQGSGDPVDVAGNAALQVTITGAGYPYDTGVEEFSGPKPLPGSGTKTVTEVVFDATFEGTTVAFVGTTAKAPFRVYALSNPTRVVLEVRDA